jgi:hypothetical protein
MTTLGNPLLLGPEGYQISRSVRLRSSASAYFNRTPAGAGNRKTWTYSCWVKRGVLGTAQFVFSTYGSATDTTSLSLFFNASDQLCLGTQVTDYRISSAVYRDPSAWYHVIAVLDANNGTTQSRMRLWVNGSEITAWATNTSAPTQDFGINLAQEHRIGSRPVTNSLFVDGYLAEINFIDGQALTPSSFGETDVITGVWKPKKYAGTYGTNGFFLNFSDNSAATAAAIGKDYSGNGNNWTPNNISVTAGATYDSMIDVPTLYADGGNGRGNYAVLNPLKSFSAGLPTFSEANLRISESAASNRQVLGTIGFSAGKFYWETTVVAAATIFDFFLGIINDTQSSGNSANYGGYYRGDGTITNLAGTSQTSGNTYTTNDIIGIAVDADNGTVQFYKNGVAQGSTPSFTFASGTQVYPSFGIDNNLGAKTLAANFGQRPFAYTPPTGFKALNTQNLPDATIKKGNQYFDVSLYTGTSATNSVSNSGGFAPDFVWLKGRATAYNHALFDTTRGARNILISNSTAAEATEPVNASLVSFDSSGFTLGAAAPTYASVNATGETYVAWQWKESASAGFDIVTYTGTGSARTVAHSLGVAPAMIITKKMNSVGIDYGWSTYHKSLGTANIWLDKTQGQNPGNWPTAPTSTVFTPAVLDYNNVSGATYVNYLFAEVAGFSKFGSYTGNGSADGPFVFCGFRPRFVMVKRTDGAADWLIWDTSRNTFNVADAKLSPNSSSAEYVSASLIGIDIVSNGFKVRGSGDPALNNSSSTYIFAAFAEAPFRNSLAR